MIVFFEIVQVPVAPPLLAATVRKQTPLYSTLYSMGEVKGVLDNKPAITFRVRS